MTKSALCIGIRDYPGTDRDLAGCVNDAADWAAALGKRGFEVATLPDRQAIGTGIRKAIRDLLARSRAGAVALVPWFSSRATARSCQLFELFSARPAGVRVVMISDSCHSGTALDDARCDIGR